MISLLRNLRLAFGVAAESISDDPFQFFLQLSRRLPRHLVGPVARFLRWAAPDASTAMPVLLAELLCGDQSGLRRRLLLALDNGVPASRAVMMADIALNANELQLTDRFLANAAGARGLAAALARRCWHNGAVTEAVAVLEGAGRTGSRLRNRLASEKQLLEGWAPELPLSEIDPIPNRVLHLLTNSLPHTQSGYAQRSHSILVAQQQAGWETVAITRLGYPVLVGKIGAQRRDEIDGVTYERLLPSRLSATVTERLQQQAEETLKLALKFRPSVIHATTHYVNGLIARAVAESLGVPWVYEVRGQLADTWAATRGPKAKESERYRLFRERESGIMRAADLCVTLGQAMKHNIVAAGVPENRIIVAPNAVGGDYLLQPAEIAKARRDLGLENDAQIIGTVSSLVPYEGLDDLISAFALLAPANPRLRLVVVGTGVSLPALQEQARRSGHGDRITFTGLVPREIARTYHQALDVFVVPRKDLEVTRSVTPLKPVEAMASARPVVASRLPALEEIVDDGTSGLLVVAGDVADLATKIERLLDSGELRTSLGQAGRQSVLKNRTWVANAKSLAVAYKQITEARR